ncbi:hypothetical protein [Mesorhizobium sp. B2-3-4]|uniref:hypothetical protein n=1 Tax=Mesorhizobium sp. B2-3-4 TaxID=2589959 RepID=UPI00112C20D1|nr:hypothetical protein [Mesorhizobium sp. B2-3-4]TPM38580.1 hypothetical protein FJ967_11705 [Mesorhizobium sp. B2-3-4]
MNLLLTAAVVTMAAQAPAWGPDGRLLSRDLLKIGFELVAEGDLLMGRTYKREAPMDQAIVAHSIPSCPIQSFVAQMPGRLRPDCVSWVGDRYDEYVRLKRGREEFVCVLGQSENCYRVSGSVQ